MSIFNVFAMVIQERNTDILESTKKLFREHKKVALTDVTVAFKFQPLHTYAYM